MNNVLKGALIVIAIILTVLGIAYIAYWRVIAIRQGVRYSATFTVNNVEESDKFYPHTYVTVRISDLETKTYLFYGIKHGFKVNGQYYVEWASGTLFRWDQLLWADVGWITLKVDL